MPDVGNVTDQDAFANNMFNSKDQSTKGTAQRLFGDKGSIDFSDADKANAELQRAAEMLRP